MTRSPALDPRSAQVRAVAWQVRDVYLDSAISERATRRSEFSAMLRSSGIDALIASLTKKADDLQI